MLREEKLHARDFQFIIIKDPNQLQKIFSLRYNVFCKELGVFEDTCISLGMETDEYDSHSTHVALTHHGNIVAYTRLILPCEEFPIEKSNVLCAEFDRLRTIETSRAFVVKEYRHSNTIWLLFNNIYRYCQEVGVESILSFSNAVMFNGFRKRKVPIRYIGDATYFCGHKSYPLIISVDKKIEPNFL